MPLIYCDHNFVVTASDDTNNYKDHLRQLVANAAVTFVLSPMHWIDAASDRNAARGTLTADFMDSLQPRWIFERRGIQRREVAFGLYQFLGIANDRPPMIGEAADVIADLAGQRAERDSRAFVAHLREIGAHHPLERARQRAFESNQQNGQRFREGTLMPAVVQRVERQYVRQLLPAQTPNGIVIDARSKNEFIDACRLTDFPSVEIENRATYDNWRQGRQLNRNEFVDQQHLIALPYVDYFLTNDARLRGIIGRISEGLPFRIARLLTKGEFDAQFP